VLKGVDIVGIELDRVDAAAGLQASFVTFAGFTPALLTLLML
jgi:hypothetical protein